MHTNGKYIMVDGTVTEEHDLLAWGRWYETAKRKIANTIGGGIKVSTVFLAMDHQFGDGPPLLFETMVFGGPIDGDMDRYSTREEAETGHAAMVKKVWPNGGEIDEDLSFDN